MKLILPENYDPVLDLRQTQEAIKYIRDTFQKEIGKVLGVSRISAPLFVPRNSGLNDNLNGFESPVSFEIKEIPGQTIEVVHSLAKWKRMALKKYNFKMHEGLYTNMNAIRKDEEVDNLHSYYVDQWDWEKIIAKEERNEETLKHHVREIFKVIKHMEHEVWYKYPQAVNPLPDQIHFITSQELEDRYPDLVPTERENRICKELGCVFVMGVGKKLKSGIKHDGRAPDYDDWDLNGDILFWFEPLQCALEISSMGIRVDEDTLVKQLKEENCFNAFSNHGHILFDNDKREQFPEAGTTGRDADGSYNDTLSVEDFLDLVLALMGNNRVPTDIIMHPLTWVIFARNSMIGNGLTYGAFGGNRVHPWGATQGTGGFAGLAAEEGPQQLIMRPEQVQNRLPMPLTLNFSPFVAFDKVNKILRQLEK